MWGRRRLPVCMSIVLVCCLSACAGTVAAPTAEPSGSPSRAPTGAPVPTSPPTRIAPARSVRITVARHVWLADAVVPIVVHGLAPRSDVTVTATTDEARDGPLAGQTLSSTASFIADAAGTVDLTRAAAHGDYTGVSAMGLLWSMRPAGSIKASHAYADHIPASGQTVHMAAVVGGVTVATATMVRLPRSNGVVATKLRPAVDGFYADYWAPAHPAGNHPAVLLIGGSSGGLATGELPDELAAQLLASHGYPTLVLAYFKEPDLPPTLSRIPLEYFATAIRWLDHRPGVDAHRVVAYGVSRGSEAALLLGAYFPTLVGAVVAGSPSNVVLAGYPAGGPSWTVRGQALPYQGTYGPAVTSPDAAIPVERIKGPIFLICGGSDKAWESCAMQAAIRARLAAHGRPAPVALSYPNAGHGVGYLVRNVAYYSPGRAGRTRQANAKAVALAYPKLATWLASLG